MKNCIERFKFIAAFAVAAIISAGCGGGNSPGGTPVSGAGVTQSTVTYTGATTPRAVANAGTDQNVTTGTLVTLDGSASNDTDGDTLTYKWGLMSKPANSRVWLTGNTTVSPTFTT